jgi:hypothetical protein
MQLHCNNTVTVVVSDDDDENYDDNNNNNNLAMKKETWDRHDDVTVTYLKGPWFESRWGLGRPPYLTGFLVVFFSTMTSVPEYLFHHPFDAV